MPALPVKGNFDGSTPGHNEGMFQAAIGDLRDYLADLLGALGTKDDALAALRVFSQDGIHNLSLLPSVAANALTMNIKTRAGAAPAATDPVMLSQRNATAGSGDFNLRKMTAAVALTVSSGSTLGTVNSDQSFLYWYLIDNAGAQELAVSKQFIGSSGIVSTTSEGGAGGADSGTLMYSATARSNVPYRCIGRMKAPQTTAGTWTALPSSLELWPFNLNAVAGDLAVTGELSVSRTSVGGQVTGLVENADNTNGSSNAVIQARIGGTSGGDPSFRLTVPASLDWSVGIDNSDSDKLKIGPNAAVGTSTSLTIDTSGQMSLGTSFAGARLTLLATSGSGYAIDLQGRSGTNDARIRGINNAFSAETGAVVFNGDGSVSITYGNAAGTVLYLDNGGRVCTGGGTPVSGYTAYGDIVLPATGAVRAQNTAKFWVNFNGTGTPTANDSFNLSSITDNGTGDYTLNFTNALANANFSAAMHGKIAANFNIVVPYISAAPATSSSLRIVCARTNDLGAMDLDYIIVSVIGE